MVEKQLLRLSKSQSIGNEHEIKNTSASIIGDSLVVTLYNLAVSGEKKRVGMPGLMQLNLFDVRQVEETESHEVCWPYSIKSLAINPVKHSILIISQSLAEDSSELQSDQEKTLVFELPIKLMAKTKMESIRSELGKPASDQKVNQKVVNKKGAKEAAKPMTINDAIEEFLESDFEIKASNAAKKAE